MKLYNHKIKGFEIEAGHCSQDLRFSRYFHGYHIWGTVKLHLILVLTYLRTLRVFQKPAIIIGNYAIWMVKLLKGVSDFGKVIVT